MSKKIGSILGCVVLLVGVAGIYVLSRHKPAAEEEAPAEVETVVPVEVGKIQVMTLHDYLDTYGRVIPDPGIANATAAATNIDSPLDGIITEVHCSVGQQVKKGDILFAMYDQPARLAVEKAEKTVKFAQAEFERQESLQKVQGTSTKLYQQAKQDLDSAQNELSRVQTQLMLHKISAPFDGTIMDVLKRPGEAVLSTDPLARLTDMGHLVIKAGIPSRQAGVLKLGQQVQIDQGASTSATDPTDQPATTKVDYIDQQIDPNNDTVAVIIRLPADTALRPGQLLKTRIVVGEHKDQIAVPEQSVVTNTQGQTVVAIVQNDEAVPIPVKCGASENHWIAVEGEGLKPGMNVVTTGAYGLPGKTKIRMVTR